MNLRIIHAGEIQNCKERTLFCLQTVCTDDYIPSCLLDSRLDFCKLFFLKMDVISQYRENRNLSSSEEDSEDSDNDTVWKRAPSKKTDENEHLKNNEMCDDPLITPSDEIGKIEQPQQLCEQPKPGEKRKRNTIWCDVLQDQLISEDLEDCLLKNKPRHYGSRGKESYDYTRAFNDERREDSESEMSGCSLNEDSATNLKIPSKKYPFKKKLKKFVKLDSSELDAARKINKVLNEKKYYLIQRIVKFVGIEKAMHLLELTKEIEENGGMMIKNNTRRRTPGGVYIQMLKDDDEVTKEVLDKIFEGEMSGQELRKYFEERKKWKKKNRHLKRKNKGKEAFNGKVEVNIEPMEPDETAPMDAEVDEKPDVTKLDVSFPSVPVSAKESSENVSDLEEGEIED